MRITNSMMLNTSKSNINNNKVTLDKFETQLATEKKIQKPSEDPIVALRSLRLRKNVSELKQYYEKNISDAESWLEVTESSIKNMSGILGDMYTNFTKGANGEWSTSERVAILEDLEASCGQYYGEGNSSYAGRTIFTGYKTDTNYVFKSSDLDVNPKPAFQITETFTVGDIKSNSYVSQEVAINSASPAPISAKDTPQISEIFSFSLAYTGVSADDLKNAAAAGSTPCVTYQNGTIELELYTEKEDAAFDYLKNNPTKAVYIAETGEVVFGETVANTLRDLGKNAPLSITYNKSGFKNGEVNPVFYFDCVDISDPNNKVVYTKEDQAMEYQVGPNQYLKVNTQASEVLDLNVVKDIRRLRSAISDVQDTEAKVSQLEEMLESTLYSDTEKESIQSMLDATNKELDLKKSIAQELFEHGVDDFQAYQDDVEVQKTDLGNRDARLSMIKERTSQQLTTFNELLTKNEDVNLSDVILNSTAATYAYQLSLQAVGSINQLSLLNYL